MFKRLINFVDDGRGCRPWAGHYYAPVNFSPHIMIEQPLSNPMFFGILASGGGGGEPEPEGIYFSESGGDDLTGDGTMGNPYQSLEKAEEFTAIEDSVLYFKRGDTWTVKGTSDSISMLHITADGVTLDAYGVGAQPKINCGGTVRKAVKITALNTFTKNLHLYNAGNVVSSALWANEGVSFVSPNTIEDCKIDSSAGDGIDGSVGTYTIARRVVIQDITDDGYTLHGNAGTGAKLEVYGGTVTRCFDGINNSYSTPGADPGFVVLVEDVTFYNNTRDVGALDTGTHTFNRCRWGVDGETQSPTALTPGLPTTSGIITVILNACIIDARMSDLIGNSAISNGGTDCTITLNHCTLRGNPAHTDGVGTGSVSVFGPTVLNNCILRDWWRFTDQVGSFLVTNYCILSNIEVNATATHNNRIGNDATDPLFVSATDDHLQSGSPARNSAPPIVACPTDFEEDAYGADPVDIGALTF